MYYVYVCVCKKKPCLIARWPFAQSDGEKSDQDLVVDDASEDPTSPVVNGAASPRENGLDKGVALTTMSAGGGGIQAAKKDAPPHSPRSGTSSNASTPSTKKMEEREKATTPISKPLTPTSIGGGPGLKPITGKLLQGPSVMGPATNALSVAGYSAHYSAPAPLPPPPPPPPPPHHHLVAAGQHPHVDMLAYNGYAAPRLPASLQLYDSHAIMRASIGIPGGKP